MENIESPNGATPSQVSPSDLSDEELQAVLSGEESSDEEVVEEQVNGEPEGNKQEDSAEPESSDETDYKSLYQDLKEKSERREAHLRQVELFSKRQSNQLGEARKQLKELIAQKTQGLDERMLENPRQAFKDQKEIDEAEEALAQLDEQEAMQNHTMESFEIVANNIPKEEFDLPGMVQVLKAEGYPDDFLHVFEQNPFAVAHGETLVHLSKRTKAERMLSELVTYTKNLYGEYEKLKGKSNDVLKNIERVSKQTPSITSSNGGVSRNTKPSQRNIANLTDAELDEYLANNRE